MKSASEWSTKLEQDEFSELMFTHKQWEHIVAAIQGDAIEAAALEVERVGPGCGLPGSLVDEALARQARAIRKLNQLQPPEALQAGCAAEAKHSSETK